jgi:glycosyltransferase involved in cell wall biosynthesis
MYKIVDRVITLSQNTCRLLIDTYKINSEKIAFISNGIDDFRKIISIEEKSLIKSKLLLNEHEKIILFVGRTHFAKGVYSLIKSFEKVLVCYPNCRLVFVGAVLDFSKISYYTKNISSKIIFTGQLTKEELNNWYQIADIGVLPSYSEQCSYTGMEMMMYQIPIIASDGFGVNEMFKDGINAKVAKTGNRSNSEEFELNITNAILELLNSEDLSQKLGKNARKIYENSYHIKYMQKGYRKLFEKLLDL